MRCPFCGTTERIMGPRIVRDVTGIVNRFYRCGICGRRWNTDIPPREPRKERKT